jgi:predicted PurR-regulated permease PerM
MTTKNSDLSVKIYLLLIFVGLVCLLYILAPVLQPLFIAALIAYLSNPLVEKFQKIKVPRILSVLIVFFLMLALLILLGLFLIPMLVDQINLLIRKIPDFTNWLQATALPWINAKVGGLAQVNMQNLNFAVIEGIKSHQDVVRKVITTLTSSGYALIIMLFEMLLIPVVTFYLLRDWNKLIANCRTILPRSIEPTVVLLANRYNQVLRAFLRGQLLVMIILSILYTTGLWLVGLQFAVLIGFISGFLNIVPYLGFTIGILSGLLAAYLQFHDFWHLIYVLLVYLIGLSIESMLLTPLLVGDSIGLHPVAVIFSVLTGGYFFGLMGALIALPVAAAIMVLMRYGLAKYYKSSLYSF